MQNSHSKIRTSHLVLLFIILTSPLAIYLLLPLLPTFDDWTYITYPNKDPKYWKYLLPFLSYWRPFDGAFGYIVGLNIKLFPALNHILTYVGHLLATFMIWNVARQLKLTSPACAAATIFYYISPAILGMLLTCDAMNQAFASVWGLCALWIYLRRGRHHILFWIIFSSLAVFSKENGIMWIFISPIIAWGFGKEDRKEALTHILYGVAFFIIYWIIRLSLPNYCPLENNVYLDLSLLTKAKNFAKYIILSYTSIDFVSLFYKEDRNIIILALTTILSLPLFCYNIKNFYRNRKDRRLWILLITSLIAASPHLLTLFSAMHAYAGLGPLALLIGILYPYNIGKQKIYNIFFCLFVFSALLVDYRHWKASYISGMTGYNLAQQTIAQTKKTTNKAYCISIDHGEKKYSSFCVIPYDAFGWGLSMRYYSGGKWPQKIENETIKYNTENVDSIVNKKLKEGFDHVWIVNGNHVKVIERK